MYEVYAIISALRMNVDVSGDIGPFQLAIALTVVTLIMIIFWPENYGGGNHGDKPVRFLLLQAPTNRS